MSYPKCELPKLITPHNIGPISAIVICPVSPFASVKCWADDGGLCRLFKLTDLQPKFGPIPSRLSLLLWHPVSKVEEPEYGPWTAHYWAMYHFHHGKTFWKWKNQSSAHYRPVAVPKISVSGQSMGQNWPPSAYRSYHSSSDTILAIDLRKNFDDAGPVLGRI